MDPPDICPHCSAEVPADAKACPECGSDENTGWSVDAHRESLGLPDENFNYNDFANRELTGEKIQPPGIHFGWWLITLLLLALFIYSALR